MTPLEGHWDIPPEPYVDPAPPPEPAPLPPCSAGLLDLLDAVVAYRIAYRAGDATSARSTFDTLEATARELAERYGLPFA